MANFKFDTSEQLIDFLFNAKLANGIDSAFDKWETTYIIVKTASGLEMAINTRVVDTSNGGEYLIWKKIKNMIKAFWEQNNVTGITLDIRLLCPQNIKNIIDPKNGFSSFRLSFYCGSGVIMATSTNVENATLAPIDPIVAWNAMITDIFNNWQKEYNKRYK